MQLETLAPACRKLLKNSQCVLGALLLIFGLGGCEKYAGLLQVQAPTVKSHYLNPPRPSAIVPPKVEIAPLEYWNQKKVPNGKLVCLQTNDYVSLRVFNKEISFWMKQSNSALDYHESMNKPPPVKVTKK